MGRSGASASDYSFPRSRASRCRGSADGRDRHPLDHRGARLRRRHDRHDGGHAAEPRGRAARGAAGAADGAPAQPRARLCQRRGVPGAVPPRRRRRARSVHPRRRGLHPQRAPEAGGLLGRHGHRSRDRTADHDLRVDRPAGAARLGRGRRGHVRHLRRHPRHGGQPHRLHGTARLSRLALALESRRPHRVRAGLPGAARQLHGDAALPPLPVRRAVPDDPARRGAAAHVALLANRARGVRPRRLLRAGRFHRRVRLEEVHRQARVLGPRRRLQRAQARLDERDRRLPQRRRRVHRLHDAGLPRQVHAVHERAAGRGHLDLRRADVRPHGARAPQLHEVRPRQGAVVAPDDAPRKDAMTDGSRQLVEMAWDPITRIIGSLGIHTKIDFANRQVAECRSTSSIFRGYSVFMKGKDPRDAHQITSRICGICGDNHATCAVYAQNMAFGVVPPALAEWIINLGEAAEYMFDHNLFQDNLVGVDYCEQMVRETNPGVLAHAERTAAPHTDRHGYRTIAAIMRAPNPFTGVFYREALQMSRLTREMFCLMEGRHVHPSTLYPGGVGTVASPQLFTEYTVRLMRYIEFLKRSVPLHDDLFDFFYEALPGYEAVGRRRVLLACWGAFQNPDRCDFTYARMAEWGREMYVTPGIVIDGQLRTTDLVEINLGIRVLLGSSFYDDWQTGETFVRQDPLGNPVDQRHPWNQTTTPRPQKRDFAGKYTWVMSPRWYDAASGAHLALDTGGGPLARFWATALAGRVDIGHVRATGTGVEIHLPKTALAPPLDLEWRIPAWSNTLERNRARSYFQAYAAAAALHFVERAVVEVHAGRTKTWSEFRVPDEAIGCGFHEAVRGALSHHLVIRQGKIANYHPYPPTPWNASPRNVFGTPGPYEDAVQNTPIFEENGPDTFKGIDIMRTVRSFDPCMPCGVHMYLGNGKELAVRHSPTFGAELLR